MFGLCFLLLADPLLAAAPTPLELGKAETPPAVDGRASDPAWKAVPVAESGRWRAQALISGKFHYVLLTYRDAVAPREKTRRRDDPGIMEDDRVELVGEGRRANVIWRVVVTPNAVFDAQQTSKFVEEWTRDLSWDTEVSGKVESRQWTIEVAFPSEVRRVGVWRRGPSAGAGEEPLWIEFENPRIPGNANLEGLSREERRALAERQAQDPETHERANRQLEFGEAWLQLALKGLPFDEYLAQLKPLGQQKLGPDFEARWTRFQNFLQRDPDAVKSQYERQQGELKGTAESLQRGLVMERAMVNGVSLPSFQALIEERLGPGVLDKLGRPADAYYQRLPTALGGGWGGFGGGGGRLPDNIPKTWNTMTEDAYQALRTSRLTAYTQVAVEMSSGEFQRNGPPRRGEAPRPR